MEDQKWIFGGLEKVNEVINADGTVSPISREELVKGILEGDFRNPNSNICPYCGSYLGGAWECPECGGS